MDDAAVPVRSDLPEADARARRPLILYASETGTAEGYAARPRGASRASRRRSFPWTR
jgi:hypothetical protein